MPGCLVSIWWCLCGSSPQEQQRNTYENRLRDLELEWHWWETGLSGPECSWFFFFFGWFLQFVEKKPKTKCVSKMNIFEWQEIPSRKTWSLISTEGCFIQWFPIFSHYFYRYHPWKFGKIVFNENQEFGMRRRWSYLVTKLDMANVSLTPQNLEAPQSLITQTQAKHPNFTTKTWVL